MRLLGVEMLGAKNVSALQAGRRSQPDERNPARQDRKPERHESVEKHGRNHNGGIFNCGERSDERCFCCAKSAGCWRGICNG